MDPWQFSPLRSRHLLVSHHVAFLSPVKRKFCFCLCPGPTRVSVGSFVPAVIWQVTDKSKHSLHCSASPGTVGRRLQHSEQGSEATAYANEAARPQATKRESTQTGSGVFWLQGRRFFSPSLHVQECLVSSVVQS